MIVIVDYQMGNIGSIVNMLKKIGAEAKASSDPAEIRQADKIILPGVGSFDQGMKNLKGSGLQQVLEEKVLRGKAPVLGICLGMQLFANRSEEGVMPGLGWIAGDVKRFSLQDERLKVPHMGWNYVAPRRDESILEGITKESRFYFVHSYHFVCDNKDEVLLTSDYGDTFVAAVKKENVVGVQFHPEKSHKFGMHLLRNFAEKL